MDFEKLNYYTCIAPAGATSEDTTLPMMIRYTNEETVVLSVFNGVICSALVPFLISFCYNIFKNMRTVCVVEVVRWCALFLFWKM